MVNVKAAVRIDRRRLVPLDPTRNGGHATGSAPGATTWQPRSGALRLRILAALIAIDLICMALGFGAAVVLREALLGGTDWFLLLPTMPLVYLLAAANSYAYSAANLQNPLRAVRRGVRALTLAVTAAVFIAFSLKTSDNFPRFVTGVGFVLSAGLMAVARYTFVRHLEAIVGGNPFSVVLIRDGDQPVPPGHFSVLLAADTGFDPDAHDPVMYDRLARSLQGAYRVVVACSAERRATWAHALKGINIQGEIIVPELAALAPLGVGHHGDTPTMVVATGPLGLMERAVKRSFDLAVAGIALVLLAPLLVAVAIAVKLDTPGPVFFRQVRIGRGNEMFRMLKFRSMRAEQTDGAGHRSAARDDDRITRVGRFIRSTSIDELPQLFNVLQGNMSIVGPRPHALGSRAADKLFWEVDQRYWHRHSAKPGLTGLAQIRGFRGATLEEVDLANRLQADLEYLENWSIWRDLKILALTVRVILHRNAF